MIEIIYHDGKNAIPCPPGQTDGFENAEGNGEVHCYPLLDGVSAMLMRLEMESYTELRTQKGMLEINFCVDGRFETHFSLRDQVLLKPGDMAISCYDGVHGTRSESRFPLGYYEGICLEIEPSCGAALDREKRPGLFREFRGAPAGPLGEQMVYVRRGGAALRARFPRAL